MENNNIAIVLDALGEKIAALELDLQCEQYKNAGLENQVAELTQKLSDAECKLAARDTANALKNLGESAKSFTAMRGVEVR